MLDCGCWGEKQEWLSRCLLSRKGCWSLRLGWRPVGSWAWLGGGLGQGSCSPQEMGSENRVWCCSRDRSVSLLLNPSLKWWAPYCQHTGHKIYHGTKKHLVWPTSTAVQCACVLAHPQDTCALMQAPRVFGKLFLMVFSIMLPASPGSCPWDWAPVCWQQTSWLEF